MATLNNKNVMIILAPAYLKQLGIEMQKWEQFVNDSIFIKMYQFIDFSRQN